MRNALIVFFLFFAGTAARAETVHFHNGDRLSGEWIKVEKGKVVLKTDSLGEVAIPLKKIKSFSPAKRVVVSTNSGQVLRGELQLAPSGDWNLNTGVASRELAANIVEAAYPQSVYEPRTLRAVMASWLQWKASANFGYNLVRGDRDAGTLSLGLNATRGQPELTGLQERWRTTYQVNALFTSTRSGAARISANSVSSSLRQDFFFTPNNFLFGLGQMEHIQPQSIDFRQTYGFGVGHDLKRTPRHSVSFLGGTTFVNERLHAGGRRQNFSEALLGQKLSFSLASNIKVAHQFTLYPNLSEAGEFRLDTTSTLTTRITPRLSFNVNFIDRYLTLQLPGRKNNQLVFTTGLGIRLD